MNNVRKFLYMVLFFIFSISLNTLAQPAENIPEFTLYKLDKTQFKRGNLNTDKLLLFIFFDVKCEHCQQAITQINKRYSELSNVAVHLITLDHPEEVKGFLSKHGNNLLEKNNVTLFFDLKNEFITRFKPRKYPSIFLYSPQKKLILYDDNPEKLSKFFEKIKGFKK